jgi:hypothetical protein
LEHYIDKNGKLHKEMSGMVKCDMSIPLEKCFVVVLVKDDGWHKTVEGEESFDKYPTDNQIRYSLAKYPSASYARVETKYSYGLPFK